MAYKWKDDPKKYMNDYVTRNVKYRRISFSANNHEDMQIHDWISENFDKKPENDKKRNFSQYVKQLIKEDMEKQNTR